MTPSSHKRCVFVAQVLKDSINYEHIGVLTIVRAHGPVVFFTTVSSISVVSIFILIIFGLVIHRHITRQQPYEVRAKQLGQTI